MEEIKAALDSMEGDKALGADGFNFALGKACREMVGPDLLRVFKEFHRDGIINRGLENSFDHPCA